MEAFQKKGGFAIYALIVTNALLVLGLGPVAYAVDQPWFYVLAFVLVGARGQSLYILQHEAMHNLISANKKTNEVIGVLLSAMLGTQFYTGRKMHMLHHRLTGAVDDPNTIYHGTHDKQPGWQAAKFFLKNLLGWRLIGLAQSVGGAVLAKLGLMEAKPGHAMLKVKPREQMIDLVALFAVQLVIFAGISLAAHPLVYIGLFLLPLSTLTCFFEALRSFSEHVLPSGNPGSVVEERRSFFMKASWLELFFISQFGFHYHHVHHQHPNIPTLNVARLHRWKLANDPAFKDTYIERPGYVMTAIRYCLGKPIPGMGNPQPSKG
jgi:fatty acid desaturase